jgi:cobalt-zinc-cadmium efflux system outer membrane protein
MSSYFIAFLHILAFALCSPVWAQVTQPPDSREPPEPLGDLTLADCLELVLEHSPELSIFAWEPRKAEARTLQAGLRPNPELSLEIQDIGFGGQGGGNSSSSTVSLTPTPALGFGLERDKTSDSSGGLDSSEITLSLSQLVELGGKRMKRVRLAQDEERLVDMDYEIVRVEVFTSTARAFYDVLLLQHRLDMATSFASFAKEAHAITQARVQAGKLSPLEESRSDVELRGIELETEHAEHELSAARIRLAAHWGSTTPQFGKALGSLSIPLQPEAMEGFLDRIEQSPDIQRWTAERERRESELLLERATARPNITVTAGLRSTGSGGDGGTSGFGLSTIDGASLSRGRGEYDDRELSFLVGVSVPLRLFHRNQGRILEAELAVEQLSDQERSHRIQLRATVSAEWQALVATYDEAKTIEEEILPKAQQAFELTQEGYRQGKFGLLDVLLSQRALFDMKKELLDTFARHYEAKVEMERYTGQSVHADFGVASPIEEATQ